MQRYDRQVRLWSASGQDELRCSSIWAIGKSIAVIEVLKNLALAGIGKIWLTMDSDPLGTLFDNDMKSLNESLQEMNPDLSILNTNTVPSDGVALILVNAPNMHDDIVQKVHGVPKIVIGSSAFSAAYHLDLNGLKSIPIIEPHSSPDLTDLRFTGLDEWPELAKYCERFDLDRLDEVDHRHVPFAVLLTKALSSCDKIEDIERYLMGLQKYPDELNFKEAIKYMWRVKRVEVPQSIHELVRFSHDPQYANADARNCVFWSLVRALGEFIELKGRLPISGIIPDMISKTNDFVELKRIYQAKADEDCKLLQRFVDRDVLPSTVKRFCTNARYIRALVLEEDGQPDEELQKFMKNPAEILPVSSFIGGIASQEAMKLLMGQYTPVGGSLYYDALQQQINVNKKYMQLIN